MNKKLLMAVLFSIFSGTAEAQTCTAVNGVCTVTEASGIGDQSLKACIDTAVCSKILFGVPEVTMDQTISFARSNVLIDGEGITKLTGNLPMLFEITKSNIVMQNLAIVNAQGMAIRLVGSSNTIANCTFSGGGGNGVSVYSGLKNLISMNTFSGMSSSGIALFNGGNLNLSSPELSDAYLVSADKWEFKGKVISKVTRVELYEADPLFYHTNHTGDIPQGMVYLMTITNDPVNGIRSDGTFVIPMDLSRYHPAKGYVALSFDANNNTSVFSKVFIPTSDSADFFGPDFSACSQAPWFMNTNENVWGGDFDGDGMANGVEDRNKNCTVDPGETNPSITDTDGDGVPDLQDNCGEVPNPLQEDSNNNGRGDACEGDQDGDRIPDSQDNCPFVANVDQSNTDADSFGDACDADIDGDGYDNGQDNCFTIFNADQKNTDGDGFGDLCDKDNDDDRDGVTNGTDNCPLVPNPLQSSNAGLGTGNVCNPDIDGDGISNLLDNCPLAPNANQLDTNANNVGDACELDLDGDSIVDASDNCVAIPNQNQNDLDLDRVGDACDMDVDGDRIINMIDNCPTLDNSDQLDTDLDGQGDICDLDLDGDGVTNKTDNCPLVVNTDQKDSIGDGVGDLCDKGDDTDQDGVHDFLDNCPYVSNADQSDIDNDGIGDLCTLASTSLTIDQPPSPDRYNIGGGSGCALNTEKSFNENAALSTVLLLSLALFIIFGRKKCKK